MKLFQKDKDYLQQYQTSLYSASLYLINDSDFQDQQVSLHEDLDVRFRNEIIPQIEKINPKFLDSLNSLSKITKKRNNKKKVRFGKYKGLEIKEVIKILFSEYKYFKPDTFLGRNHYEMLENILLEETFSENLPGKIRIYRKNDELFFQDLSIKKNIKQINKKILIPGKTILREDCQIITRLINKPKNIKQINKKSIYINRKYYDENLFIRIRNNGDRINSIRNEGQSCGD